VIYLGEKSKDGWIERILVAWVVQTGKKWRKISRVLTGKQKATLSE